MKKTIILHSLPSETNEQPILAFPILKSFLKNNGYNVRIIYWELILKEILDEVLSTLSDDIKKKNYFNKLAYFIYLLSYKHRDNKSINKCMFSFLGESPEKVIIDNDSLNTLLAAASLSIRDKIKSVYKSIEEDNILCQGVTARYQQWITALYFCDEFKLYLPSVPIVIGGIDNKEKAFELLSLYQNFDYAVWGEGEYPFLELLNIFQNKGKYNDLSNLSRLVYRDSNKIFESNKIDSKLINLDDYIPEFDDYFQAAEDSGIKKEDISIPIESGRGCRWNRCKFCILNMLYNNYRRKSSNALLKEINSLYKKHGNNCFTFTDNDIEINEYSDYSLPLDGIISMKQKLKEEITFFGEFIPSKISEENICKLSAANFEVQIGYEATTDVLLKKLNKISRFSDLLLFLKMSAKHGLLVTGTNVLTGLPDEKKHDIRQAASNLPFLRFFLGKKGFKHNFVNLSVQKGSIYYNELSDSDKCRYSFNKIYNLLPVSITDKLHNRFSLFPFYRNSDNTDEWNIYQKVSNYLTENDFFYKFIKINDIIYYKEYCNEKLARTIVFNKPEYISILRIANKQTVSYNSLLEKLNIEYRNIEENRVFKFMKELYNEYLLFYNSEKNMIISIVDVDLL